MKPSIKIGVGGRFHSDRLANALMARGWDVSLVTSFPKSRFPSVPAERIESYIKGEVFFRLLNPTPFAHFGMIQKMKTFGKDFSKDCSKNKSDLIFAWSGFGLEAFKKNPASVKVLIRDSFHIQEQVDILEKEYRHFGYQFPDHKEIIQRELEEYALADKIVVLSVAAKNSFLKHGVSENKIEIIRLGADLSIFKPMENKPEPKILRVVYFGTIGIRKGTYYLLEASEEFFPDEASFTMIGSVEPEFKPFLKKFPNVTVIPPKSHQDLAEELKNYDVFVMPTLEDGFGLVVPQAMAAGLVPIVSTSAGASEFITDKRNGILIPPRDPKAIVESIRSLQTPSTLYQSIRNELLKGSQDVSWKTYEKHVDSFLRDCLLTL